MKESEILDRIKKIKGNMRLIDSIVGMDYSTGVQRVTKKQAEIVKEVIDLLQDMSWAIRFSNYKELKQEDKKPFNQRGCGQPVKIRSCKEGHGDKTYFGILLGDAALGIAHSVKDEVVTASYSHYNPAIFVPELGEIIYGCESWWGRIESEEEMNKLITDKTISDVWYVKLLREQIKEPPPNEVTNET